MPKKPSTTPTGDWRDTIIQDLPEPSQKIMIRSYASALELIRIAAFNRRMSVRDFIARAALAVAVYDHGDITWEEATEKEPPLPDLRRWHLPRRRLRGKNFGPWKIEGMSE